LKTWEERQEEKDLETRTIQENITRCQGNGFGQYNLGRDLYVCTNLPVDTEVLCPYLDRSIEVGLPGGLYHCCKKREER